MKRMMKSGLLAAGLTALVCLTACIGRSTPTPIAFDHPLESRLILQMPYFADGGEGGAPGAMAEVLTYNGRVSDPDKVRLALDGRPAGFQILAVMARQMNLRADFRQGTAEDLLAAVRANQPVIIRLGLAVQPLKAGDWVVVVGYTPDGPVLNSGTVNQQIVAWSDFLTSWLHDGNQLLLISSDQRSF